MSNHILPLLLVASCLASCGGGGDDPDAAFRDGGSTRDAAVDSGSERDGGSPEDGGDPCASLGCASCVARAECGWCAIGLPGCLSGSTGGPYASSCNGEGSWWYSSCPPPAAPIDPLASPAVMRVDDGYEFVEGPQWVVARGVLLFSDIPATTIHELTPPSAITPYDTASGGSNGLAIDLEGRVLRAEHGGRRIARERADGSWETLADRLGGQRLNSPNDLVVARDGTIYFTDPPYGLEGRPAELDFVGVFRLEPDDGTLVAEKRLARDRRPNGIVLSPDESILYVADSALGRVDRYAVLAGGALGDAIDPPYDVRSPDGLAIDQAGNVYAASADGIVVIAPDGREWGRISIPERPANCAFGGADQRTLYVTAGTGLYAVTGLAIAGVL